VVEGFGASQQEGRSRIKKESLTEFTKAWSKFDPMATGFITCSNFEKLLYKLKVPLGFQKGTLIGFRDKFLAYKSMDIPMIKGKDAHLIQFIDENGDNQLKRQSVFVRKSTLSDNSVKTMGKKNIKETQMILKEKQKETSNLDQKGTNAIERFELSKNKTPKAARRKTSFGQRLEVYDDGLFRVYFIDVLEALA